VSGKIDQLVDPARLRSILKQVPQPKRVLELGCGDCCEVPLVSNPGAFYIGLDLDHGALRRAGGILQANLYPSDNHNEAISQCRFHLIQADIVYLPFRTQFDLILVRHPDVDRHRGDWELIFTGIAHLLTESGTLILTTYSVPELELISTWLAETGSICMPLDTGQLAEPDLVGRDRFVSVHQKIESQ
jgi:SAM-dependent methyltransferase